MKTPQQVISRQKELISLIKEAESVSLSASPKYSRQQRESAHAAAASLVYALHQIEWVIGVREHTFVDDLL